MGRPVQWRKQVNGGEYQNSELGDFPIQTAESSRKQQPIFVESYLGKVSLFCKEEKLGYNTC